MTFKILIIEDNKDLNNLLYFLISVEKKYEVKQGFDGEQGMNLIEDFIPDIVVLDILLPKIDGREILSFIQTFSLQPQVIVFSSSGQKGISASNVHYCPKSKFSPQKIKEFIDKITNK